MRGTRSLKVLQASALAMLIQTIILASTVRILNGKRGSGGKNLGVLVFFC